MALPNEFTVYGSEEMLKPLILQLLAQHYGGAGNISDNWIGYPIDDYITSTPEHVNSKLFLQLYGQKSPPYNRQKKRVSITIPEVPKEKIDWETIKRKIGNDGYLFGRFLTTIIFSSGRQTHVYASTKEKSYQLATELAELSSLNIRSARTSEIYKTGIHDNNAFREYKEERVYPGTMYVLKVYSFENGKKRTKKETPFIPLWTLNKPDNFNALINELWVAPPVPTT